MTLGAWTNVSNVVESVHIQQHVDVYYIDVWLLGFCAWIGRVGIVILVHKQNILEDFNHLHAV